MCSILAAAALEHMHVPYTHEKTRVLRIDQDLPRGSENPKEYGDRGWCVFERRVSNMKDTGKNPSQFPMLGSTRRDAAATSTLPATSAQFRTQLKDNISVDQFIHMLMY